MNIKKNYAKILVALTMATSFSTYAQTFNIEEDPTNIRFEQYTGSEGAVVFWRLPSPGSSSFPGSTCKNLSIPSQKPEQSSRFMALYLFAKNNNKKIFYYYNTSTCVIISFGIDGWFKIPSFQPTPQLIKINELTFRIAWVLLLTFRQPFAKNGV